MSQNLTQPQEIEHIWIEMASRGLSMDTPRPDGYRSSTTIQNVKSDGVTVVTDFSCGTEDAKSTHGFSESHPYVWSM